MAWLWTRGKGREATRCEPGEEDQHLPDIGSFDYLAELLFDIGPASVGWETLRAYRELSGVDVDPWEAQTLVKMSKAFDGAVREFDGVDADRPYLGEEYKAAAINRMQASIRGRKVSNG